ncbi:MAG TPA: TonB-dependent receptor [Candidatus Krumholzibacteria bacterium]|nr:TonB-dependent receptor [Candidatus Krumholzibacteria bacterium]
MRAVVALLALIALCAPPAAHAQDPNAALPPRPDSLRTVVKPVLGFDAITRENFLRRHAFSLDHFLEFQPDGFVARLGPIGNEAYYSRLGIGRGRAVVMANGIPMNDPQDGTAPLVHIATSGISTLTLDPNDKLTFAPSTEGSVAVSDLVAPPDRPSTFIELSKASNQLRQRRVRFGSEAGPIGLDLSYDEVLNDGYDFDFNEVVPLPSPQGANNSRNAAVAIRGDLPERASYNAGLRRFRSSTTGDLLSSTNESSRSGHLAWANVGMGATEAVIYGRGYRTTRPDSSTSNESVGGTLAWNLHARGATLHMFALGERTNAYQNVGHSEAHDRVSQGNAGASTEVTRGGFTWFGHGVVGGDTRSFTWGAGAGVKHDIALGDLTLSAQRTFRLPSIGERYLPLHARDGFTLAGLRTLDPETALETSADWTLRRAAFINRVRASWMRSEDYILFAAVAEDSLARRAANSSDTPTMSFVEERVDLATNMGRVELLGDAGARWSTGDRTGLFQSVPRAQVNASLTAGTQLFEKTSAVYLGVEYQFVDTRRDYNGVLLPSFSVVNASIVARLLDARFYARWLNMTNAAYQTVSGYLMTPRTLEYGIEWTLFD